jgi:hypothetical protein
MLYNPASKLWNSMPFFEANTWKYRVDLMQLVEEAIEGCWIGHQARMFTSEIGSVYSPPKHQDRSTKASNAAKWVETIIDVDSDKAVSQKHPEMYTILTELPGLDLQVREGGNTTSARESFR